MLEVTATRKFAKNYKKRINSQKLRLRFENRLDLFKKNPKHKLLKDHILKGSMKNYRAFWIAGDLRVIYEEIDEKTVKFIDVGSHNQVY